MQMASDNEIPFVDESDIQAQYSALDGRDYFTSKEIAIHLARFAEARTRVYARKIIERLEKELAKMKEDAK
jgi:hypothetical protein